MATHRTTRPRQGGRVPLPFPARAALIPVAVLLAFALPAPARDRPGWDLHELAHDSSAVVVATVTAWAEFQADLQVEQWLKGAGQPGMLRVAQGGRYGHPGLEKDRRCVVFLVRPDASWHALAVLNLEPGGRLPEHHDLSGFPGPAPKDLDGLAAQLRRLLTPEYEAQLIAELADPARRDEARGAAARHLGLLHSRKALGTLATAAREDALHFLPGAALEALWRIDPERGRPVCLDVIAQSRREPTVRAAAHRFSLSPGRDPKAIPALLAAARRWQAAGPGGADAFADLLRAAGALGQATPELEAIVLEQLRTGTGNPRHVAFALAGQLKLRAARALVERGLEAEDPEVRRSAKLALAYYNLSPAATAPARGTAAGDE